MSRSKSLNKNNSRHVTQAVPGKPLRNAAQIVAAYFGMHHACPVLRCRRERKCCAPHQPCFKLFWPAIPEIEKERFRAIVTARTQGKNAAAAIAAGETAAVRYQNYEASLRARDVETEPPRELPAPRVEPPQPRIRQL
jgi:hypothetical protein